MLWTLTRLRLGWAISHPPPPPMGLDCLGTLVSLVVATEHPTLGKKGPPTLCSDHATWITKPLIGNQGLSFCSLSGPKE